MFWAGVRAAVFAAAAALLARIIYAVFRALVSPLRTVPGPFLARFSRLWYLRELARENFEQTNIQLHRKYGKIVRVAPNWYSFDDPEAIKVIYNKDNIFSKSKWYTAAAPPGLENSFTTPDNKLGAVIRRKMANVFTMSSLLTYESLTDECGDLFIQKLQGFAHSGKPFDLGWWITCYAFDVQGNITYSERFGFLDNGEDIGGIHQSLDQRLPYATLVGVYPEFHSFLFKLINWIAGGSTRKVDYAMDYSFKRIAARKAGNKPAREGPPDMLSKFLASHQENPQYFTEWDILMGTFGNIVAGADTTWITLNAIMYHLMKTPESLAKLREEIDSMAKKGEISDPVSFKESQTMPYLQAVLKESQRMYTATALPLFRDVPAGGATISGKFFPGGTTVGINQWVAHHNREVFAPDPDTFRPERWLDENKEKLTSMNYYYMPFGVGPRQCQGLNVAQLVMSKIVPQLVRKFDFELDEPLKEGVWQTANRWLIKQIDFRCKVMIRDGESAGK